MDRAAFAAGTPVAVATAWTWAASAVISLAVLISWSAVRSVNHVKPRREAPQQRDAEGQEYGPQRRQPEGAVAIERLSAGRVRDRVEEEEGADDQDRADQDREPEGPRPPVAETPARRPGDDGHDVGGPDLDQESGLVGQVAESGLGRVEDQRCHQQRSGNHDHHRDDAAQDGAGAKDRACRTASQSPTDPRGGGACASMAVMWPVGLLVSPRRAADRGPPRGPRGAPRGPGAVAMRPPAYGGGSGRRAHWFRPG